MFTPRVQVTDIGVSAPRVHNAGLTCHYSPIVPLSYNSQCPDDARLTPPPLLRTEPFIPPTPGHILGDLHTIMSDSEKEEAEPGQISPQTSSGCYPHVWDYQKCE